MEKFHSNYKYETNWLERTELLIGNKKLNTLKNSNVLIVGLGGVGAYAAEQICRAGVGNMTIADGDVVEESNRNRQLPALISTTGQSKTEIMAKRLQDINTELKITTVNDFISDNNTSQLLQNQAYDYVVDAIDTLSPKVFLLYEAFKMGLNTVSSMGAGGKLNPLHIQVTDISESYNCRLARGLRKRLSKLGIKNGIKVVFSPEEISKDAVREEKGRNKKSTVGTISYMPPIFGCFIASVVIKDLIGETPTN